MELNVFGDILPLPWNTLFPVQPLQDGLFFMSRLSMENL